MKRRLVLSITIMFLLLQAYSQNKQTSITTSKGSWSFQSYAANIVKATFQPANYKTNELVSDAVILKPGNTLSTIAITSKGDTIYFGSKTASVYYSEENTLKGFKFLLHNDEKIFGAGERALPLNRRGYRFNLYNAPAYGYGMGAENLNYSVPFITSSNHYAVFFDNPSKGFLDIGKTTPNILQYGAVSGQLNFYIITGSSYPEIITSYHKLTGTQPLPPRWALGNFLSRFGYTSEGEIKDIMQKMKDNSIPYDAVIFDLFWFGDSIKGTMGNLDWINKKAWPNPRKMIADFKKEGTQTILITEPFVVKSSLTYNESKKFHAVDSAGKPYVLTDFYFGEGGLIDIFKNDSKQWFWSKYRQQMNKGVEGWWGDLGEPEKHPSNMYHNLKDVGFKRLFAADEIHNIYGHYWTKMLYDYYAKDYPNKRLFSLNRSGFAGTQRYGIFPWTGDVSRTWSGLQAQLPVLLGMSMSGVPYVHSDAGGYAGGDKDGELYVRWLQFASFAPIFRPHGTELTKLGLTTGNFPSEPALMEEPYKTLAKEIVSMRYKMLPYNYTLSYQQAKEGKPLISPLYYYFSSDTATYSMQDEYMWGENLLIAPVIYKGAKTRTIYLPKGKWFDFNNNIIINGATRLEYNVENYKFPVFIKEGSFIPEYRSVGANTREINKSNLSVLYVASSNASSYKMFDDDGESKNSLSSGKFELITFSSSGESGKGVLIRIHSTGKNFKGKPNQRNIILTIPAVNKTPKSVVINGKKLGIQNAETTGIALNENKDVIWKGSSLNTLSIPVIFKLAPISIDVKW